ncbi:MAG TPA: methyltransferase domain-containing protein [Candidatus Dormibacteraeota bacterium]|nr:methyltransferase domain-containing protein [Candidatus Dormibacteraeota bacterium]
MDEGVVFAAGVQAWQRSLGSVHEVVRQELVTRQLHAHLGDAPLRVLDAGCGQGTQAIRLARRGHHVLGVDVSEELLEAAAASAAAEPPEVAARLELRRGDLLDLGAALAGGFDLVCCHGVAMYLPSLAAVIAALVTAARPGGLVSILTRNRASLAMRAGMAADWPAALAAFDARRYTNRLGLEEVRADEPAEVRAAFTGAGASILAWYGVRLFIDHWPGQPPPPDLAALVDAEEQAGRRDPYRAVAALTHTLARTAAPG